MPDIMMSAGRPLWVRGPATAVGSRLEPGVIVSCVERVDSGTSRERSRLVSLEGVRATGFSE